MKTYKERLRHLGYIIIFGSSTRSGRLFDVALIYLILLSLLVVMLESTQHIREAYGSWLIGIEWVITIIFTIEYILRVLVYPRPREYILSTLGIIDFLSFFPTYFTFFFPGAQFVIVIRALRLLRIFRVLKLKRYLYELNVLANALRASRYKLFVFMLGVVNIVLLIGTTMYLIEGPTNGFTSIPKSLYWAIVTITTVGYGDIAPNTVVGQILASILMFTGYAILAVPTGLITVEYTKMSADSCTRKCNECGFKGHEKDALHCKYCGGKLSAEKLPHHHE